MILLLIHDPRDAAQYPLLGKKGLALRDAAGIVGVENNFACGITLYKGFYGLFLILVF
jgi:hypothetical protein